MPGWLLAAEQTDCPEHNQAAPDLVPLPLHLPVARPGLARSDSPIQPQLLLPEAQLQRLDFARRRRNPERPPGGLLPRPLAWQPEPAVPALRASVRAAAPLA